MGVVSRDAYSRLFQAGNDFQRRALADVIDVALEREAEDVWRVRGVRVERLAAMTVWNLDEPVRRFRRTLEHVGIVTALEDAGVEPGDTVLIGEREMVWEE